MDKKLGVLVIHGMGSHGEVPREDSSERRFSDRLYRGLFDELGGAVMARLDWREVQYSHVLEPRQRKFLTRIRPFSSTGVARDFVLHRLSDAASYRVPLHDDDTTYVAIHHEVDRVTCALKDSLGAEAPILVLAHSLGGHVMSNHIYDLQKVCGVTPAPETCMRDGLQLPVPDTALERLQTVVKFVTFGCNIPVFVMGYPAENVSPIRDPGSAVAHMRDGPWWGNYYARRDILGYPLVPIGAEYRQLAADGGLVDIRVGNGRGIVPDWWWSHVNYWTNRTLQRDIGDAITTALDRIDHPRPASPSGDAAPVA